jgi:P2 family phage contractile tail tube protein
MVAKILKNFSLFADGRGYVGKAEEVTPPKLTIKKEEFRAGGMDAPITVDMGMEGLELQFSLIEYDKEVMKTFGVAHGNSVAFTLRGALCNDTTTVPMVIKAQGMYTEIDMGKFKAGDKSTLNCTVACRYYSLEIDGENVIEIDIENMVRKIAGNDVLADIRDALGI